jgi:hypothetical protein
MTVVIGGTREEIPGIASVCWLDGNPKVKYVTDKKKRERVCRGIVCHTHEGVLGELLEGLGPNTTMDERLAMYQTQTDRIVSWDWTQDQNGDVTWQNDPLVDYTFHGNQVCDVTVGFELIQKVRRNSKGEVVGGDLYSGQIAAAVLMIDFITARLGIQRQIPWDKKRNRPVRGVVGRIAAGGGDVVGIYGHRNITTNRGAGDPGDAIFFALRDADILFTPIGGGEVLSAPEAYKFAVSLGARLVIPMNYDAKALDAFLKEGGVNKVEPVDKLTLKKKDLDGKEGDIVVISPSNA